MKIIDKTPFLNDKGELGISQRIQGMLKYGFNWPNELQAQKAIITYFDRQLEKGYTLIRNYILGQSGIMVPIILLGPTGIYVIHIAFERGRYEVKGEAWNVAAGEAYKPAPVNLIQRTMRMANAVKSFIERQRVRLPVDIEPVLIAGDPGLHIESVQPAIRVLMIDGIKSFVSGLATGQPVLSNEQVYELTDRLLNPHFPRKEQVMPPGEPRGSVEGSAPQEVSRARAIFDASQNAKPFDPSDFDFDMDEEPNFDITPPVAGVAETSPVELPAPSKARSKRTLGMSPMQLAIVAVLVLALVCILAGFGYYVFAFS